MFNATTKFGYKKKSVHIRCENYVLRVRGKFMIILFIYLSISVPLLIQNKIT